MDWYSDEVENFTTEQGELFRSLPGHIWLSTSGSTQKKLVALSKHAFLTSAEAVNQHLQVSKKDYWLNPLPSIHVGGLCISARCMLSGAKEVIYPDSTKEKWNPQKFYQALKETNATIASIVPAQLQDFVNLPPPQNLRVLLVGGAALKKNLCEQAQEKRWPVVETYGCTECCSQVATGSPQLKLLPHTEVKIDEKGLLWVKSSSLLTTYAFKEEGEWVLRDPKKEGWFCTQDYGSIKGATISVQGRGSDFINIGGETVSFTFLQDLLSTVTANSLGATLLPMDDDRLGQAVHLCVERRVQPKAVKWMDSFNNQVRPFEKVRQIHIVDQIPRSPLGKIKKSELTKLII